VSRVHEEAPAYFYWPGPLCAAGGGWRVRTFV